MYHNSRTNFAYSSSPSGSNSSSSRNNNGSTQGPTIRQGLTVEELKMMTAMRMATNNIPTQPSASVSSNPASSYQTATPQQLEAAGITPALASGGPGAPSTHSHHPHHSHSHMHGHPSSHGHLPSSSVAPSSRNLSSSRNGYNTVQPLQVQRQNSLSHLNKLPSTNSASHHHNSAPQHTGGYNQSSYYSGSSMIGGGSSMPPSAGSGVSAPISSPYVSSKHTMARPTVIPPIQRASPGSGQSQNSLPSASLTPITHSSYNSAPLNSINSNSNSNSSYSVLNHSQYKLFSSSASQHSMDSSSQHSNGSSHHHSTSSTSSGMLKNFSSNGSNLDSFTSHAHEHSLPPAHAHAQGGSLSQSQSHPHSLLHTNDSFSSSFSNHFNSYSVLQLPSSSATSSATTSSSNTLSNSNLNELHSLYSERDPSFSEKQPHSLLNFNSFLSNSGVSLSNNSPQPLDFPSSNLSQSFLKSNSPSLPLSLPTSSPLPPTNTSSRIEQETSNETDYFTSDYFPSFYSSSSHSSFLPHTGSTPGAGAFLSESSHGSHGSPSHLNINVSNATSTASMDSPTSGRNPMVKSKTVPNKLLLQDDLSSSLLKSHSLFPKKLTSISPLKENRERERDRADISLSHSKLNDSLSHAHSTLSLNNTSLNNVLASQVAESVLDTPPPSYSTLTSKRISPLTSFLSPTSNLHPGSLSANISSSLGVAPPGLTRGATVSNFNSSSSPLKHPHHLSSLPPTQYHHSLNNVKESFFDKPMDLTDERMYWSESIGQDDRDEERSVKSLESLHPHSSDELDEEDALNLHFLTVSGQAPDHSLALR